jgi:GINS complex subunit 1
MLEPFQGSFDPNADQATACTLLVNHLSMRRNKRCLLAYHRTRTDKLEELVWNGADVLDLPGQQMGDGRGSGANGTLGGEAGASSLSPQEEDYVRQYSDLLAAYKGQWTDIDLTGSLEPPRDLFIDVRVLKDSGEIQTEYGLVHTTPRDPHLKILHADRRELSRAITLSKNSQFYVRQGDVERLIAQGYLQKLS